MLLDWAVAVKVFCSEQRDTRLCTTRREVDMGSEDSYHRVQSSENESGQETAQVRTVGEILGRVDLPTPERPPGILQKTSPDASVAIGDGRMWDEDIINTDDRVRVPDVLQYPWRAICALRI